MNSKNSQLEEQYQHLDEINGIVVQMGQYAENINTETKKHKEY